MIIDSPLDGASISLVVAVSAMSSPAAAQNVAERGTIKAQSTSKPVPDPTSGNHRYRDRRAEPLARVDVIDSEIAAEERWIQTVNDAAAATVMPEANSWHLGANVPGKPRIFMPFVGGIGAFREICGRVKANSYEGSGRAGPPYRCHTGGFGGRELRTANQLQTSGMTVMTTKAARYLVAGMMTACISYTAASAQAAVLPDAAAVATPAPVAPVQQAPAATRPDNDAGDIVVTANRRSEPLSRVGVSVAAVGAQQLKLFNVEQPQDLRRVVPGFQALEAASTGAPVFVLRGVGFDSPTPATSSPVGIYMDEAAVPYPYMALGLAFDLERVEVLKGPQGTLYGRNATGGLVNFIAAKPTSTWQAAGALTVGSYSERDAEGFISGPISGSLRARIAFQTLNRLKGWQRSVTRPDDRLGKSYRDALRGTLEFEPSDRLNVTATGTYWKVTGDTQAPQAVDFLRNPALLTPEMAASLIPNVNDNRLADWTPQSRQPNQALMVNLGIGDPNRPPLGQHTRFYSGTLRAHLKLTDQISLASLSSYDDLKYNSIRDFGGLQTESLTQQSVGSIRSFSQEIRLLGEYDRINWSVGAYYAKDKNRQHDLGFVGDLTTITQFKAFLPFFNGLFGSPFTNNELQATFRNYAGFGNSTVSVKALFANAEAKLSDQVKIRAGARYTQDRESGSSCALNVNGGQTAFIDLIFPVATGQSLPPVSRNGCYTLSADNSRFEQVQSFQKKGNLAWRLGTDYTPNQNTLLYAVVSRGFKSGSFPVFAAANAVQLTPVRPEQLTAYEAGAKLRLLGRALSLNGSIFYYDYKDRQTFGRIPDLVFGSLLRIVNIPKSHSYGAEAEMNLRLTQYVTAHAGLAYLKTKVDEFTGFDVRSEAGTTVNFAGAAFPYSPKLMASGSLVADVPVNSSIAVLGAINANYQSRSSAVLGREPGFDIKSYTLVGVKAGVHDQRDRWSVEAFVNNVFNTYYYTSAQRGNETLLRYAGMPRTLGVRLGFKY